MRRGLRHHADDGREVTQARRRVALGSVDNRMLTDDGSQVTDCFATEDKKPSGKHAFDEATPRSPSNAAWYCRHPQTDGMVERLDGRINELLQQTRFDSKADLEATLMNYLKPHYHHIPHRALDAKTPIPALKEWQKQRTE